MKTRVTGVMLAALLAAAGACWAGPYAGPTADADNPYDAGVAGWTGPAGEGLADVDPWYPNPGNAVNPAFVGWATEVAAYEPAAYVDAEWTDTSYALGPASGDEYDVVSLGDMDAAQIAAHLAAPDQAGITHPGFITLSFDEAIYDGPGADLAVFENGFSRTGDPEFFAELAYVEVSSDGVNFVRFPSVSQTVQPEPDEWAYASIDVTGVYNLAGKHANAHGVCWGTPFDLAELAASPEAAAGLVNLYDIRYVRIVDIPGSGDFCDAAGDPIYDGWRTSGSGGFDLDAVGALHAGILPGDADGDGAVDIADFVILKNHFGGAGTWGRGDFDGDGTVNIADFVILKNHFGSSAAAPEPTSAVLLLAGAAGVGRTRRRRA